MKFKEIQKSWHSGFKNFALQFELYVLLTFCFVSHFVLKAYNFFIFLCELGDLCGECQ